MRRNAIALTGLVMAVAILAVLAARGGEQATAHLATTSGQIQEVLIDAKTSTAAVTTSNGVAGDGGVLVTGELADVELCFDDGGSGLGASVAVSVDVVATGIDTTDGSFDAGVMHSVGIRYNDLLLDFVSVTALGPVIGAAYLAGGTPPAVDGTYSHLDGYGFMLLPVAPSPQSTRDDFDGDIAFFRINFTTDASATGVASVFPENVSGFVDSQDLIIDMGKPGNLMRYDIGDDNYTTTPGDNGIINSARGAQVAVGVQCPDANLKVVKTGTPATTMAVNDPTAVNLSATISSEVANGGATIYSVRHEITTTDDGDCTLTLNSPGADHTHSGELIAGNSLSPEAESFTMTCTTPGDHDFTIENVVSTTDAGEGFPSDNTETLDFSVNVTATADASVSGMALTDLGSTVFPGLDAVTNTAIYDFRSEIASSLNAGLAAVLTQAGLAPSLAGAVDPGATIDTLTDTGNFAAMNLTSKVVIMTGGAGAGQYSTIFSNDADTLTLTSDWTLTPSLNDTYIITSIPRIITGDELPLDFTSTAQHDQAAPDPYSPLAIDSSYQVIIAGAMDIDLDQPTPTVTPRGTSPALYDIQADYPGDPLNTAQFMGHWRGGGIGGECTVTSGAGATDTTGLLTDGGTEGTSSSGITLQCAKNSFAFGAPDGDPATTNGIIRVYVGKLVNTVDYDLNTTPFTSPIQDVNSPILGTNNNNDFVGNAETGDPTNGPEFLFVVVDDFTPSFLSTIGPASPPNAPTSDIGVEGSPLAVVSQSVFPNSLRYPPNNPAVDIFDDPLYGTNPTAAHDGQPLAGTVTVRPQNLSPVGGIIVTNGLAVAIGHRVGELDVFVRTNLNGTFTSCSYDLPLSGSDPAVLMQIDLNTNSVPDILEANQPIPVGLIQAGMTDSALKGEGTDDLTGTAADLLMPNTWSTRLEADPVIAGVMATGALLWASYATVATVDVDNDGDIEGNTSDAIVPIHFVTFNAGDSGFLSVSVVGDPSNPDPVSDTCTTMVATTLVYSKAIDLGTGLPDETLAECYVPGTGLGDLEMPLTLKTTREDSGGEVILVDATALGGSSAVCTEKTDASVMLGLIPPTVDTDITTTRTVNVTVANNQASVTATEEWVDVVLSLTTTDVTKCTFVWSNPAEVSGYSSSGGGETYEITYTQDTTLQGLAPVAADRTYDITCTDSAIHTDLLTADVSIDTFIDDAPADLADNAAQTPADVTSVLDKDFDGTASVSDNCRDDWNDDQADADDDTVPAGDGGLSDGGNACDDDDDNDLVLDGDDSCTPILSSDDDPNAQDINEGTATSLREDHDGSPDSPEDGCADTNASTFDTGNSTSTLDLLLEPGIGDAANMPIGDTVLRTVRVTFRNGNHEAKVQRRMVLESDFIDEPAGSPDDTGECLVEFDSLNPTATILVTRDYVTGVSIENASFGSGVMGPNDSQPVDVTLAITCNAAGTSLATLYASAFPLSPVREEDFDSKNVGTLAPTLNAGLDTDGDTIPDSTDGEQAAIDLSQPSLATDCDTQPEDVDGVEDNDGCPDVDPGVTGASAAPAGDTYDGFPTTATLSANVSNSGSASSASVVITVDLSLINGSPAAVTLDDATIITASLGGGLSEPISTGINIDCAGVSGSGTVTFEVAYASMTPAGSVEASGTGGDNTDNSASLLVNCLSNDPQLPTSTLVAGTITDVFDGTLGTSPGDSTGVNQDVKNNSAGTPDQDADIEVTFTVSTSDPIDVSWTSSGNDTAVLTTGLLAAGVTGGVGDTLDVVCNGIGSFSATVDSAITDILSGAVDPSKDKDGGNNTDSTVVTVDCELDSDGDCATTAYPGCLDTNDMKPTHDVQASNQIVQGPGIIPATSSGTMFVTFDITNAINNPSAIQNEITEVSVDAVPVPAGCILDPTTTAVPVVPNAVFIVLAELQTKTVTWQITIDCSGASAGANAQMDVTATVDLVKQVGDGDENIVPTLNSPIDATGNNDVSLPEALWIL